MKFIISDPSVDYKAEYDNWDDFYSDKLVCLWLDHSDEEEPSEMIELLSRTKCSDATITIQI